MKPVTFLLLLAATFTSCKKWKENLKYQPAPDVLPAYSETGANTFGCLVDGKVLIPNKYLLSTAPTLLTGYGQDSTGNARYYISATDYISHSNMRLVINASGPIEGSVIPLEKEGLSTASYAQYTRTITEGDIISEDEFRTRNGMFGSVHIQHFDTLQYILSGTFAFDAQDTTTGKVVQIREGRFDVKLSR